MRRFMLSTCIGTSISAISLIPVLAAAQSAQTTAVPLDTITVYATRTPTSAFDVPAMTTRVDTDAPGRAAASTISDLLDTVPGVDVDNGPRRNGQTVSIRGFDDEAVITLIDGRRQNFESAHDGRFFIDPALLKSVEIVRGPASAIYGGGGIGGVVAFETKDASDLLEPDENVGAITSYSYRTVNGESAPFAAAFARSGGFDFLGSVNYRRSGDIRTGDHTGQSSAVSVLRTRDRLLSGMFKAGYTFADFHTVKLQYNHHRNDGLEPNNGAGSITNSNPVVEKDVRDDQIGIKYEFNDPSVSWLKPKFHVYQNESEVEETDISGSNSGRIQTRELETIGFTVDNQSRLPDLGGTRHLLSYGFEYYTNDQVGRSSTTGTRGGVPNADAVTYGLYLQNQIDWDTSVGSFSIIPAARFDSFESDDQSGNSQDESQVSPKLSVSFKPTEDIVFFGSLAQAFRAPNLTELYPSGQHFFGNNFTPNPDLKPETVTTFEVGAGWRGSQILTTNDSFRVKGAVHYSDGDDFISQVVSTSTTQNVNVPNAVLMGYELEGEYRLSDFRFTFGVSEVFAENDDTGEYLSNNTPLTFVGDLAFELPDQNSTVGWKTRMASESDRASSSATKTAGFAVHDLYYRWKTTPEDALDMTLDLGVENVFDKLYSTRFASLPEEGRNYVAKVSLKW